MIADTVTVLERLTLTAPLGVVFHDTVTGLRVGSGLDVSVYQKAMPLSRAKMFPNPSGVFVLQHAPGLSRDFEFGAGDDEFWSNLPQPISYVMEVSDREGRFQPFSSEIELPLPQRGIFRWVSPLDTSPPDTSSLDVGKPASVPLYSAPARTVPPGMAVVRADLLDTERDAPAAWAIVEAHYEGNLIGRGMSDARGSLALIFPFPEPVTTAVASPLESQPSVRSPKLYEQTWEVSLGAAYAGVAEGATVAEIPDLRATLEQLALAPARLWRDHAGGAELTGVALRFGRETVLKTEDAAGTLSPPARSSALLITPAGSPP
ncbi:MAG: hypothetical protein LC746_03690 [Acidobacteria bacterium]|nr:hypothetical protein [Acidobacteriota bacterium]